MDRVSLSEESRERILQKTRKAATKYGNDSPTETTLKIRKYLAIAACFVILMSGAVMVLRTGIQKTPAGSPGAQEHADIMESQQEEEMEAYEAYADEPAANQDVATGLLILFVTAIILSAIGFIKYVYFFSVGYGFSVAGIGAVMLVMFRDKIQPAAALMCGIFILYGLRLGSYLLYREIKSHSYKVFLKNEIKSRVSLAAHLAIWISCALLYVCECSPVYFRLFNHAPDNMTAYIGIILMAAGTLMELLADMQKSKAKKVNPGRFVDTGLYRFVRCPNYFGEILLWTGVLITGIKALHGPLQWALALFGYIGIIYVMFSGTRRLEIRQDKTYGQDPEYQEYIKKTPILIPFLPLYSVKKHKWLVA